METQMLGFRHSSHSKVASAALAALMLSASASFAASTNHRTQASGTYQSAQPNARAQYGISLPNTGDTTNQCIGGYRYMQHFYDANRTAEEDQVPLPRR